MANVTDIAEFEVSKENIQPIQQGRKPEVLKSAFSVQPEDKLIQQRKLFEQELRSYSGDDPLSVWCRYIKWVEQNYPKGGREGNIAKLIQQCLLILKDDKLYQNDDRFIDVWLKLANMSVKTVEIYSNMYSRGIGCQMARFYIAWAWENEQLGNLKQADEILTEGIRRNAQPIDNLKSTHAELEMRLAQAFGAEVQKIKCEPFDESEQRSAFNMLKAQSKNKAPISRVGDSTIPKTRQNMTIDQQQPQPLQTKNSQSKIPFKIYSGDNEGGSLPSQTKKGSNFALHSESTKENERKPSKWAKVKVQQGGTHVREVPKSQEFTVHCDNTPQPNSVKKLPPTSHILTSRKGNFNPPMIIFEPPDPMKKPMYNKVKVYGGAEEYSFEELMAVKWYEKQRKVEKERKKLLEKQEKEQLRIQMQNMQEKILYLENLALPILQSNKDTKSASLDMELQKPPTILEVKSDEIVADNVSRATIPSHSLSLTIASNNETPNQSVSSKKVEAPLLQQLSTNFLGTNEQNGNKNSKLGNTYMANEVDCMMRELYNGTLGNNTAIDGDLSFVTNLEKNDYKLDFVGLEKNCSDVVIPTSCKTTEGKLRFGMDFPQLSTELPNDPKKATEAANNQGAFFIYRDPTEVLPPASALPSYPIFHNDNPVVNDENASRKQQDTLCKNVDTAQNKIDENVIPKLDLVTKIDENVPAYMKNKDGDYENIPPADYVQQTEKRELSGILQPSKNIHFVPLEQQLQEEEEEEEDEMEELNGGCLTGVRPLDDNLTLLTAEQFAAAAHFMSTPCIKPQNVGIRESAKKIEPNFQPINAVPPPPPNDSESSELVKFLTDAFNLADSIKIKDILKQLLLDLTKRDFSKDSSNNMVEMLKLCHELSNSEKLKMILQRCAMINETIISKTKEMNQTNVHHHTLQLSTIMETSRESKSSSSSSCTTSMSKHKSIHNSIQLSSISKLMTPIPEVNGKIRSSDEAKLTSLKETKLEMAVKSDIEKEDHSFIDGNIDPFDSSVTSRLLNALKVPLSQREDFYDCRETPFNIKVNPAVFGNLECMIENVYAEGAYAKVYSAQCFDNSSINFDQTYAPAPRVAIKVCKNANDWEFYICSELADRLTKKNILLNSILKVKCAVAFQNSLILVSDLFDHGTLLDVVNIYKIQKTRVPECIIMLFALEMLDIISGIHNCGIVHGDVKPDNFILNDIPSASEVDAVLEQPRCLRLIDFGRAIDLTLFKPKVSFSVVVKTDGFQCVPMREDRPWVYETDWYGVLACIHILLFSEYMDVRKNAQGQWEPVQKFKRYFQTNIWQPLFQSLLNIPSPYEVPDLTPFIKLLKGGLCKQMKELKMELFRMGVALNNRPRSAH